MLLVSRVYENIFLEINHLSTKRHNQVVLLVGTEGCSLRVVPGLVWDVELLLGPRLEQRRNAGLLNLQHIQKPWC